MDRTYVIGVILVTISAVVWSSAGIFTRGVSADAWSVIFWRGIAATGFTLAYMALRGVLLAEFRGLNKPTVLAIVLMASGTAAFIPAFKLSSVANVALIRATAPFVTAGLSWLFLREAPSRRVLIASFATLFGVGIVAKGSVQSGLWIGDLLAFWMALMMSASFVVYRRWPKTPAALPSAVSAAVLVPIAWFLTDAMAVVPHERWIITAFGAVFATASVLMMEGARRIPSAEVALISALETPVAVLLGFVILAETPPMITVIGGMIIMAAVIWSQWRGVTR
ncbi:EamA family transporter [Amylibacter sp. IMCC11727]|uniref:DMT family transporter n=1 Tax=Amylibacter sp. IMCC11727 TaxID=3039851 RepID=UPI00244DD669|nr:EamA family transporter [Amylibacter sp. IMCC11727]WGI22911.1 EamA family transporter [Amylibacter sp. IMCC11727]